MTTNEKSSINRRALLKVSGALAASALLAGCVRSSESSTTQVPPTAPGETITLMHVRQDFTEQQEAQFGYWYSAMAESDANRGSVVMLPGPTWSGERRNPTVTAAGMVMTSATKLPDAAWTFFEWYNGGQPSLDRARSGWAVPALKSQMSLMPQTTDLQKQAYQVLVGELALKNSPIQFNPFIGESTVAEAWNRNLKIALNNDLTFDSLVANLEAEVNTFIQENA